MPDNGHKKNVDIDLGLLPGLVGYQLRRAQIETFQHFAASLGEEGMRPGWFGLLIIVANNPGLSQTQLARSLGVDGSTMVAMIDRMERAFRDCTAKDPAYPHLAYALAKVMQLPGSG